MWSGRILLKVKWGVRECLLSSLGTVRFLIKKRLSDRCSRGHDVLGGAAQIAHHHDGQALLGIDDQNRARALLGAGMVLAQAAGGVVINAPAQADGGGFAGGCGLQGEYVRET